MRIVCKGFLKKIFPKIKNSPANRGAVNL
jgi:hypothetical protein